MSRGLNFSAMWQDFMYTNKMLVITEYRIIRVSIERLLTRRKTDTANVKTILLLQF